LPKESKKKAKNAKEKKEPNKETKNVQPTELSKRDYFCPICYVAFRDQEQLNDHMKTHRELEVTAASCRMEEQPAGVF
jgi:Zinc finger, C2H2 type